MDKRSTSTVIVLPIHPEYAHAIMAGRKKVEFRKKNIPDSITHVVVYATSPEKKVLGYFSVAEVVKAHPSTLWERFESVGGIDNRLFDEYYSGQSYGLGIVIGDVVEIDKPFELRDVNGILSAPQSFVYYRPNDWRNLKRRKRKVAPGATNKSLEPTARASFLRGS